jgi:hypothetical protein
LAHVSLVDGHHLYFYEESDGYEPLIDMKGWCLVLTKTSSENVFYFFSLDLAVV